MKTIIKCSYLLTIFMLGFVYPQDVRPVCDNVGFCWQADQLDIFIDWLNENCTDPAFISENLIAGISPHDDYLYAGKVYYPLYKFINAKEVVIFGVTHGTVRKKINDPKNIVILDEFEKWKGPYNNVEVSPLRDVIKHKLNPKNYLVNNMAHSLEHSIEALIPFLQYYNRNVNITPIMITGMSFEKMDSLSTELAHIISAYVIRNNLKLGKDIFFLFPTMQITMARILKTNPTDWMKKLTELQQIMIKELPQKFLRGSFPKTKLKNLPTNFGLKPA